MPQNSSRHPAETPTSEHLSFLSKIFPNSVSVGSIVQGKIKNLTWQH